MIKKLVVLVLSRLLNAAWSIRADGPPTHCAGRTSERYQQAASPALEGMCFALARIRPGDAQAERSEPRLYP